MDATTVGIIIAILSPVVPLGIEAVKAHGTYRIGFAVAAGAFVVAAALWIPIANASPAIAKVVREIASTPSTWFTLFVVAVVFAHHWWVRRAFLAAQENALFPMGIGAEAREGIEALSRENRELSRAHEVAVAQIALAAGNIVGLEEKTTALINGQQVTRAKAQAHSKEIEALTATVEKLSTAIMAIGHREHLSASAVYVNEIALQLSLKDQQDAEARDWDEWWKLEVAFRSRLDDWIQLARVYDDQVGERIYAVSEETYLDLRWPLKRDAFPSHDAMTRYRTFRTIYTQWCEADYAVRKMTSKAAYGYS